jgi:hypothetical protein
MVDAQARPGNHRMARRYTDGFDEIGKRETAGRRLANWNIGTDDAVSSVPLRVNLASATDDTPTDAAGLGDVV